MKGLPSLAAALVTSGLMGLVLAASQEPVAVQAVPLPQTTHTAVQRAEQLNRNAARVEISTPAKTASATPSASPSAQASAKAGEETGKYLVMPVAGTRLSSPFGMRLHPITKVWKLHTGQDWAAPCGTPVGAAGNGVVSSVGWAGGYGLQVKISHGQLGGYDVVTTYNHLSATAVSKGQTVTARQAIGSVGSTGSSTGCHLHFEVVANGNFSDPMPWITGDPVTIDTSKAKMVTPSKTQTTGENNSGGDEVLPATSTATPSAPAASSKPASNSKSTPTPTKPAVTKTPAAQPTTKASTTPKVTTPKPTPTVEKTTVAPAPQPSVAPEPTKAPVEPPAPESSSAAGS